MREEEGVESLPRFRLRWKRSVLTMFFFANPKNKQIKKKTKTKKHNYPNCKVIADLVLVR